MLTSKSMMLPRAQSTPTKAYAACQALPALTDFRWHRLPKRRHCLFQRVKTCFLNCPKVRTDSYSQLWKGKEGGAERQGIPIMTDFRQFGIAQHPYAACCLGCATCFQKFHRILLNLLQYWDSVALTCSKWLDLWCAMDRLQGWAVSLLPYAFKNVDWDNNQKISEADEPWQFILTYS